MGFLQSPSSGPLNSESISKVHNISENTDANFDSYESWLIQHPSALNTFEQMMSDAKGKVLVVFLDYDGTLSHIVDDPDKAFMSDAMRWAVQEVADCFPTAIVSGRDREKVMKFVKLKNVYYAGSHGMDISTPLASQKYEDSEHQTRTVDEKGNEEYHFHPAQKFLPAIQEISKELNKKIKSVEGATIEDNKFCISVHFRRVNDEKDVGTLKEMVKSTMEAYPDFHKTEGKMVLEIRPGIKWDKSHALDYLLDTLGFRDSPDVLPIYIGDDKTDEDAFKFIKQRNAQGCQGYPIVVSSYTKKTIASYSLRDPEAVMSFLLRLADWKKTSSLGKFVACI